MPQSFVQKFILEFFNNGYETEAKSMIFWYKMHINQNAQSLVQKIILESYNNDYEILPKETPKNLKFKLHRSNIPQSLVQKIILEFSTTIRDLSYRCQ
ncbi:hypothetical protein CEXT_104221 [Caerostris extrusa]|uniref:Uncharacterized protein n=1 Tax=Caerostris extrusa TaxID=172846 RepID=A0AAV4VC97_CAEEX|nr:hypothetical protein CEXT_104221 [Caerostris extrusa]